MKNIKHPKEYLDKLQYDEYQNKGDNSKKLLCISNSLKLAIKKELTEKQMTVIMLYYFDKKTMPQIAKELGVNKSTVSRQLKAARTKLETVLKYSYYGKNIYS